MKLWPSPVPPVVSRLRSPASSEGSTAPSRAAGVPGGKIVALGAKFSVGTGRFVYGAFSCLSRLMKKLVLNGGVAWNWAAWPKFLPGEPSALMIFFERRFDTDSPLLGT